MSRAISVSVFGGSTPRRAEHLVPAERAARAVDCKLESGSLDSWRAPRLVHQVSGGVRSFYQAFNCCWLESSACTSWAEGSPEQRHVFATQFNDIPYPVRIVLDDACNPVPVRLGLPCPEARPVVTAGGGQAAAKNSYPRSYAYQYEDRFGNRSALSAPSAPVIVRDGAPVTVAGWTHPGAGWDVQVFVIYRTVSGFDSAMSEDANTLDSTWMEVARIPFTQASFVDAIRDVNLYDALLEDVVTPPPAGLRGMTAVQGANCLVGFQGRRLHFSENNNYHNWPYSLLLDDNIRAIEESNGNIYVATDGAPYVVRADVDDAQAGARPVVRMPEALPLVGSGYRSMIAVPSGVVYPTHHGLVWMTGNRPPIILSATFYSETDWQALQPDTMRGAFHEGRLFLFFRNGGCCMVLREGATADGELSAHTELSARPDEVLATRQGRLLLRLGRDVREWDRGTTLMPHLYQSSKFLLGVPFNFGALQVVLRPQGPERVLLEYDDGFQALDEALFGSEVFVLPTWATGQKFQWTLTGTARVDRVDLAPSVKEL